jgi:hypothetical protein
VFNLKELVNPKALQRISTLRRPMNVARATIFAVNVGLSGLPSNWVDSPAYHDLCMIGEQFHDRSVKPQK